jgi:hypothetical protein
MNSSICNEIDAVSPVLSLKWDGRARCKAPVSVDLGAEFAGKQLTFNSRSRLTLLYISRQAYEDQKLIEREIRRVQGLLQSNAHQCDRWTSLLSGVINELKELGDVTNWAQLLEVAAKDIQTVATHFETPARAPPQSKGRSNAAAISVSESP